MRKIFLSAAAVFLCCLVFLSACGKKQALDFPPLYSQSGTGKEITAPRDETKAPAPLHAEPYDPFRKDNPSGLGGGAKGLNKNGSDHSKNASDSLRNDISDSLKDAADNLRKDADNLRENISDNLRKNISGDGETKINGKPEEDSKIEKDIGFGPNAEKDAGGGRDENGQSRGALYRQFTDRDTEWRAAYSNGEILDALAKMDVSVAVLNRIEVLQLLDDESAVTLGVGGTLVGAYEFKEALGLPSSLITGIENEGGEYVFYGKGKN